jgi:hypothetical protein
MDRLGTRHVRSDFYLTIGNAFGLAISPNRHCLTAVNHEHPD